VFVQVLQYINISVILIVKCSGLVLFKAGISVRLNRRLSITIGVHRTIKLPETEKSRTIVVLLLFNTGSMLVSPGP